MKAPPGRERRVALAAREVPGRAPVAEADCVPEQNGAPSSDTAGESAGKAIKPNRPANTER